MVMMRLMHLGAGCGGSTFKVISHVDYKKDSHKAAEDVWVKDGKKNAPNGKFSHPWQIPTNRCRDAHFYIGNSWLSRFGRCGTQHESHSKGKDSPPYFGPIHRLHMPILDAWLLAWQ
jgi:hypothetical protein